MWLRSWGEDDAASQRVEVRSSIALACEVWIRLTCPTTRPRLAREVSANFLVLLKHEERMLPLAPTGRIALTGESAETRRH